MPEGLPYGVQRDEQGRPFIWNRDGTKNYISPVAFGEQAPEDTTGIFHKRPQFNNRTGEWETPFDWGNALNIGVGAGLGAGALSAFTGGGAAAGGAALGPSTPANIAATSAAAGSVPAALAAGGAGAAGGAAGAGGNLLANAFKNLGLKDYAALGTSIASLFGPGGLLNRGDTAGREGLERMLVLAEDRVRAGEPLFHELMAQGQSGLQGGGAVRDQLMANAGPNLAQGQNLFRAISAMANAQMPKYTRET